MKWFWVAVGICLVAGAADGLTVAVGQIHHDNGCAQYASALRGAVADPSAGVGADLNVLTPEDRQAVKKSVATYQRDSSQSDADWPQYAAQFVDEALVENGC